MKRLLVIALVFSGIVYGLVRFWPGGSEPTADGSPGDREQPRSETAREPRVAVAEAPAFGWPIKEYDRREKKLTFGRYVSPTLKDNPIQPPERFTGYHAGLDIEIFSDEADQDVPVTAACDGSVLTTGSLDGYGGVVMQVCVWQGSEVTVLYGHLDPASFRQEAGESVQRGTTIGLLAHTRTPESGFTRKHLHVGVRRGIKTDVPGYLQNQESLKDYLDPESLWKGGQSQTLNHS